jgi:Secretion system effector C (SseC) like family
MPDPLSTPTTTPGALSSFGDNVISDSAAKTFADNAKAIARAYSLLVGGGTEYGTTEPPAGSGVPTPPASPLLPPPSSGVTFNENTLSILLSGLQSTNAQETMSNLIDEMRSDSKAEEAATDVAISKLQDQVHDASQAHKSNLAGEIFGWIAVGLMDLVAIISVVATMGTDTPLAAALVASSPAIGAAVVATTMMTLQQTGAMQDIVNGIANFLTDIDPQLSKDTAKIIAMAFIGVALIAAQIAVTVASGGADAAEEIEGDIEMVESETGTSTATDATTEATADATADATDDTASTASDEQQEVQQQARNLYAKYASTAATAVLAVGQGVSSGMEGYYQSLEDKAQADVEDYKKYAKYLETIIANNQQDVLAIINTLNADAGIAASAISSQIQTDHQISEHMAPRA